MSLSGLRELVMDREVWRADLWSMWSQSQTRLSNFTLTFHFHALEKGMDTLSSILAWRIPWTEEPGGLAKVGSQKSPTRQSD